MEKGIELTDVKQLSFITAPSRARRTIRTGDVLVSTVRPYLRGMAVVPPDLDGAVASTGFAVLRATSDILPGFLWQVARSKSFLEHLVRHQTGAAYPAVRPADIGAFAFRLPLLDHQERVVKLMDALDLASSAARTRLEALVSLRDTVLEHELRDPDD